MTMKYSRHNHYQAVREQHKRGTKRMGMMMSKGFCVLFCFGMFSTAMMQSAVETTAAAQSAAALHMLVPVTNVQAVTQPVTAAQQQHTAMQQQATGQQAMSAQVAVAQQPAQQAMQQAAMATPQHSQAQALPAAQTGQMGQAMQSQVPQMAQPAQPTAPVQPQYDNHLISLQQQTQSYPNDLNAWMNFATALLEYGYFDQSRDAYLEATKLDYHYPEAHFGLGVAEFGREDLPNALFAFSEMTRLFPERFDGFYNQGIALAGLEQSEEAITAFEAALEVAEPEATPDDFINTYQGIALENAKLENFDAAAEAYDSALEVRPNSESLRFLRGEAYYKAGKGIDVLDDLIELEASTTNFLYSNLIADIYLAADQSEYAELSLKRARMRASQAGDREAEAGILVKLGLLEQDMDNGVAAISNFQTATQVDPNSWEARYNLGIAYLEGGQTSSAMSVLQNAQQLNPQSGEINLALATVYARSNRVNESERSAEMALMYLPEDSEFVPDAEFLLARAYYNQSKYEEARELMDKVVELRANDAEVQLWAGLIEYQFEEYDKALGYYERAVFLAPDNVEARINLGAAYLAAQRYGDAELVYRLIIEQSGGDGESFYNLGWALLLQGSYEDAEESWRTAYNDFSYTPAGTQLAEFF